MSAAAPSQVWAPECAHRSHASMVAQAGPAREEPLPLPLPIVLPELRVLPTPMQIFMFSAVTWNRHHIHYSTHAARAEGHPEVVVQRSLIGNYFARHVEAWLGSGGRIARLAWRVTGPAVPHQWLRCNGVAHDLVHDLVPDLVPDLVEQGGETRQCAGAAVLRLRYQGWLTTEGEREVASAEGDLCIRWPA